MEHLNSIFNIAEICAQHGVKQAILSPGSRNAPLTLAFARHPSIVTRTISDERSAAFIALGMALYSNNPVVLICTSGSAAYNYAPAIAEAFFQHVPLIILTADRPPEWIDQLDGQTIRQENIFGQHVKKSYSLPVSTDHIDSKYHFERIVNEAHNLCNQGFAGPVHINVPLREPFYPTKGEAIEFDKEVKIVKEEISNPKLSTKQIEALKIDWLKFRKRLIIVGQRNELDLNLDFITNEYGIPVVGDIISNTHHNVSVIRHQDLFLGVNNSKVYDSLQPDLLITFGNSLISKNLKIFLRNHKPKAHWHIQPSDYVADTFQSLTRIIRTTPEDFIFNVIEKESDLFEFQKQNNFYNIWEIEERKVQRHIDQFISEESLNELEAFKLILSQLTTDCSLHLANSMAVRYANFIGLTSEQKNITVYANRGTSGIDGSNSTAFGSALLSNKETILMTGDMAFFYDRNAFWHNYKANNLKIVVFNNHGGGIFNMIQGPSDQKEYKEYFETDQKLSAKHLAQEFEIEYIHCDSKRKLKNAVKSFLESDVTTILEIETDSETNKKVLQEFKIY